MKRETFPTLLVSVLCLLAACTGTGDGQEPVRNIIFMIGDGMGLAQVTALSLEQGCAPTRMERATYTGIQKTYSAGGRITDSAAAGTALACGEKTTNGTIGMTPDGHPLESVLRRAQRAGKATGIVVTCAVTDATPAAFVAHNPDRYAQEYTALQYAGSGIDLLVGAGREYFDRRSDGRDLTDEMCGRGYAFAPDREALLAARTTPLAALFPGDALPLAARDTAGIRGDYLVRATQKAIELLSGAGHDGFFLMVEGSLIDRAAHENDTEGMLGELRDFDRAVGAAFDYADGHPGTLVLVTGDHETGGLTLIRPCGEETGTATAEYAFATEWHSATFIPVFAYGTGAEHFTGVMENTDIARRLKALIGGGHR